MSIPVINADRERVVIATNDDVIDALGGGVAGTPAGFLRSMQGVEGGYPVAVTSGSHVSTVAFTRTTDTVDYGANDVIGIDNAGSAGSAVLTFGSIGPAAGGNILIINSTLRIDRSTFPSGMLNLLLELYSAAPPSGLLDNVPYDLSSGDRSVYLGAIDLGTPVDKGSTLVARNSELREPFVVPEGGILYGYLKTVGGYTPLSGTVHTLRLFSIDV